MRSKDVTKRFLFAAGTTRYLLGRPQLDAVTVDVEKIADVLVGRLGYERILEGLAKEPTSHGLRLGLSEWLRDSARTEDDIVVFYYAGHAEVLGDWHYLVTADTTSNLVATGFHVEEIVRMLADPAVRVRHLLIVLDTCFAGVAAMSLHSALRNVVAVRSLKAQVEMVVLAAARGRETAKDGCFTPALTDLLLAPKVGRDLPFVPIKSLAEHVSELMSSRGASQKAYVTDSGTEASPFFPNIPYLARLDRARRDLEGHFLPKARGFTGLDGGWLFTGRERACRELAAWLRDEGTPNAISRVRVVTGAPGSGKSAVVGRFVTLADERTLGLVPLEARPHGTVPSVAAFDVAVHARGKTFEQVVEQVAEGFGMSSDGADGAEAMLAQIRATDSTFSMVLDDLDEASDPHVIIDRLLLPLASTGKVRILLGCLREQLRWLEGNCRVIDLDLPEYSDPDDLPAYAAGLLLRLSPEIAADRINTLARIVARDAGANFLIAGILAQVAAVRPDQTMIDGPNELPPTVGGAFDLYLARFRTDRQRVEDLLRPLAFAEGDGLIQDEVWPAVATLLTKGARRYGYEDVVWLTTEAASFVVGVRVGPDTMFGIFNAALAQHLRSGILPRDAHAAFTEALKGASGAPRPLWSRNAYANSHLATHALRAGELDRLARSPSFLLEAAPLPLAKALAACEAPETRAIAEVFELGIHHIRQKPAAEAAAHLDFFAHCLGVGHLSRSIDRLSLRRPWRVVWTRWRRSHANRVVAFVKSGVSAMAEIPSEVAPVHVALGMDGSVQILDPDGRYPSKPPVVAGIADSLTCAAWSSSSSVLLTGGQDGGIRKWTSTGAGGIRPDGHWPGAGTAVTALTIVELHDRPAVLVAREDGEIEIRDVETGERLRSMARGTSTIKCLRTCALGGRDLVLAGYDDGMVVLWDPSNWTQVASALAHDGAVFDIVVTVSNGRLSVFSCGMDGHLGFWCLEGDALVGECKFASNKSLLCLATSQGPGHSLLVAGGQASELYIWDVDRREPVGEPLLGHSNLVVGCGLGVIGGKPVAISAGLDGSVRSWRALDDGQAGRVTGVDAPVLAAATVYGDGKEFVASGGLDGTLILLDALTGQVVTERRSAHNGTVQALAATRLAGKDILGSVGGDGVLRLWPTDGGLHRPTMERNAGLGPLFSITFALVEGRVFALAGGPGGSISWWDITGGSAGTFPTGRGAIYALATVTIDKTSFLASAGNGGISLWMTSLTACGKLVLSEKPLDAGGPAAAIHSVAWLPSATGAILAGGCSNGWVQVWNLRSGQHMPGAKVGSMVRSLLANSSGECRVDIGCDDGSIRSWRPDRAGFGPTFETDAPVVALAATARATVAATFRGLVAYDQR